MSEVSLKVEIAGRSYPLTVDSREEERILAAARQIEESIVVFQQNYAVRDKQDLLAMAALQVTSRQQSQPAVEKVIEKVVERVEVPSDLSPELQALEHLVDSYLG